MRCWKDCRFGLHQTAKCVIVNRQEKYCFAPRHRLGSLAVSWTASGLAVSQTAIGWVVRSGWLRDRDLPAKGRRSAVQAFDRSRSSNTDRPEPKPKPLHRKISSGGSAPERKQQELSAPRPRAGRLVIFSFALCEQRRSLRSGGSHCSGWTWNGQAQVLRLVAGLACWEGP